MKDAKEKIAAAFIAGLPMFNPGLHPCAEIVQERPRLYGWCAEKSTYIMPLVV